MAWSFWLLLALVLPGLFFLISLNWRLKKRVQSLEEEIHRMNVKRTDFVANVSHELKTPLTSIRGYTETLRNGALRDANKADAFLQRIEENAERLDSLIHDILDLSKLEVTDTHLEISELDMNELFQSLKEQFTWKLEEKNQKLHIKNDVKGLSGDKQLIEQTFSNLVANAIQYCPEGAQIQIHGKLTSSPKATALFEVTDNGPGIPEKDLPRIFERFYRADKSRNRAFGGTGLGLAIVKHIVLSHRGRLKAENLETGGMKFSLWFPLEGQKSSVSLKS